jgi:hypothetical protein
VPGLDRYYLRGGEPQLAAIRVLNMNLALCEKADMGVLAEIGAYERFYVG